MMFSHDLFFQKTDEIDDLITEGKNLDYITDLVKRKKIDYNHKAKAEEYKYSKEFSLKTVSMNYMPAFLQKNSNKYFEWFDFDK